MQISNDQKYLENGAARGRNWRNLSNSALAVYDKKFRHHNFQNASKQPSQLVVQLVVIWKLLILFKRN